MEEFNTDELEPPSWLNSEFFQTVLRIYEKDESITICELKITPGSAKGDHFASTMFRAVIEYTPSSKETKTRAVIVKTIPDEEGFKKETLEKLPIFKTEIGMYSEELPKFENVLRKYGDNTQLSAKVLYHALKPRQVIVFEDLVALGYICIRHRFVNIDEAKACLTKIAKLHAVSYKLAMEGDESVKKYEDGMLPKPKEELPEFVTGGMKLLADAVSKIKGFEIYAEKLQAMEPNFIAKCNDIFLAHKSGQKAIMVLNHGDFHGRNVMFKYDKDENLEDIMLIDFQISCYAPAVVDIAYSIFMLLDENMRRNNREELIYYYFLTFLETLKNTEYGGELPTLADFYIDMFRFKEYELWTMATFLPIVHSLLSGRVQTEDLISSKEAQTRMYLNPNFIEELKWLLPKFLHNGYLE